MATPAAVLPTSIINGLCCQTIPRSHFEPQRLFRALSNRAGFAFQLGGMAQLAATFLIFIANGPIALLLFRIGSQPIFVAGRKPAFVRGNVNIASVARP
jgi:hypothetical protein